MRAHLPLRLVRSAAFTVVCVLLAVAAHVFSGGARPAPQALAAGGLIVIAAATALAGRERPPAAVMGLLVAAQVMLHQLFAVSGQAHPATVIHRHGSGLSEGLGMALAHLTAATITGWWLAQGEAALWSVLRRAGDQAAHRLSAVFRPAAITGRPASSRTTPAPPAWPYEGAGRGEALRHAVIRRGPPVVSSAR
ncbi:hypothetical protein Pth03_36500 [Planotetraspora thailandica]|uniref:Uncharacterized protein n=1 Tax=Planotetraspora thailandica TaxID=487172 RepID=A0A8J3V5C3_9ACTN|nr:MFS transporter [Planotetraspora thailandica]GII55261.1 hypothetical protein Pth03_36500 [Planotetraspora thailandica]